MKLSSNIKFADEKVKKAFEELENSEIGDKQLNKFLIQAFENLEENAFIGIQIPKRQIPKEYIKKYGIDNCWKYNLPDAWRLLYSVAQEKILVVTIILEWLDHKSYSKKF